MNGILTDGHSYTISLKLVTVKDLAVATKIISLILEKQTCSPPRKSVHYVFDCFAVINKPGVIVLVKRCQQL